MSAYKIEAGTAQHIGNRPQQHDRAALFTGARAPGYVMAVLADGLGGNPACADQVLLTSKHLFDEFRPAETPDLARVAELLRAIALEAHDIVVMDPTVAPSAPQSTLTVLVLTPQAQAVWAWVGDSRLYRFSNAHCESRSGDSAYVDHLITADKLAPEVAARHRNFRILHNVLGNRDKRPFVSTGMHEGLQAGDAFLLCSDGLWPYFSDAELAAAVSRHTPRQASGLLIDKARERAKGQGDNCTLAIVKLVAPQQQAPAYTVRQMGKAV
jgi:serine/threonine protein phosphatase PrpC